jgi:YegS/Rv2252/BmrU family lipid kinase
MNRRCLLLINEGASRARESRAVAVSALEEAGLELFEVRSVPAKETPDLIVRHRDRVDLVVIGGGDGSLNAAAPGLLDADLPLGIIPMGTANDLARSLGLPTEPAEACAVIARGNTRRIDLGSVNGRPFLNVASIGASVEITRRLTREVKRIWGALAYMRTALGVAVRTRPFHAEIHAGAEVYHVKTLQIAIGNGRHYGGGMTIRDDAAIDDQHLDLCSLEIAHWWQMAWLLPRLRSGALRDSRHVRTLRGPSFDIHCRRPRSVNTDGEVTTRTPAEFRILPRALTVFVPADTEDVPGLKS